MPEINVKIEWDNPDEDEWMNPFTLNHVLRNHCKNTKFRITNLDNPINMCDDGWHLMNLTQLEIIGGDAYKIMMQAIATLNTAPPYDHVGPPEVFEMIRKLADND